MGLPNPFPRTQKICKSANPAFILFGSRFFADQTILELLAEFLSVTFSDKWIGSKGPITDPLPSLSELRGWASADEEQLHYTPPIKLNLKLFALLCASPLDSRHRVHEKQYSNLITNFISRVRSTTEKPEEVREWIEDFLMGFQGAGFDRTWCAQTFYPISTNLLTQETIWNHTVAKSKPILDWQDSINEFKTYYTVSRHRFLARGGELLYLQLCNLFSNPERDIESLAKKLELSNDELNYGTLHERLLTGLNKLKTMQFASLDKLVDFIENLDPETKWKVNRKKSKLTCEWCPEESWPEAYLFAVETSRILGAILDPVERLELLQIGCVLQVLRSLCAQSLRYADLIPRQGEGSALGYAWIFTPLDGCTRQQRLASCQNVQIIFRLIQRALNNKNILSIVNENRENRTMAAVLREAETRYGHKYFNLLGKRLGIIYPWKGAEPRFILTDKLLRYLVLSVIPPGESCEYQDFKRKIYMHYGIAVEGEELLDAVSWSGLPVNSSVQPDNGSWFTQMLRAGGFLVELSDGCSIVQNPFSLQDSKGVVTA